jgi:hypothetical protein
MAASIASSPALSLGNDAPLLCMAAIRQHEVNQLAMLINGAKQIFPLAAHLDICLLHSPGGRAITLIPADSLL